MTCSGSAQYLIQSEDVLEHPDSWSRDGQYLLVSARSFSRATGALGPNELSVWSFRDEKLTPLVKSVSTSDSARFSPDGHYVAYSSTESGREEAWVTTFPDGRQKWQITHDGAKVRSWRADGREILVATHAGELAVIPISTDGGFRAGALSVLVRGLGEDAGFAAAAPDHSRFLVKTMPAAASASNEVHLWFNWTAGLARTRR